MGGGVPLLEQLNVRLQERLRLPQAIQARALNALDNQADACIGNFDDLQDPADRSHLVQILLFGIGSTDLTLGHEEHLALALHGAVEREDRDLALGLQTERQVRKGGQPPQRQNGNVHSCRFHGVFTPFGKEERRTSPLFFTVTCLRRRRRRGTCPLGMRPLHAGAVHRAGRDCAG